MKKISLYFLTFFLFAFPFLIFAQEDNFIPISLGEGNTAGGVNCFDYYVFGSMEIYLQTDKSIYAGGERIKISGFLKNNNDYPIVDGYLFNQVFRENSGEKEVEGNYLVDEFFFPPKISLGPREKKEISFDWQIPNGLSGGKYFLASHFVVSKKMNLSGLSFLEGAYGGVTYFEIKSQREISEVIIDKGKIFVNEKPFLSRSFVPQFQVGEKIKIDFSLNNLSSQTQEISVFKKLFQWDNLLPEQLLKESKEIITINPLSSKSQSISFDDLKPGVYLFELTVKSGGVKSIAKIRFAINGDNPPARINFIGLGNFPLKTGQPNYIFGCFHSVLDTFNFEGKMVLKLKDKDGNSIATTEYDGTITPSIMAIKKDFNPDKDYKAVWLDALIYDKKGEMIDKISLYYNCDQFYQPADISIGVERGTLGVSTLNLCQRPIPAQMAVEVLDEKGKIVYFQPNFSGERLENKIKFERGLTYKIHVLSSGVEKVVSYTHSPSLKDEILSFLFSPFFIFLLIILVFIVFLLRKKFLKNFIKKQKI